MGKFDSFYKGGGGHTVLTIMGYRWTDEYATKDGAMPYKKTQFVGQDGKKRDSEHKLNFELLYRVDGADVDSRRTLAAGNNFEGWEISKDGRRLTPLQDNVRLSPGTAFAKFLGSLVNPENGGAGVPEEDILDESTFTSGDFDSLIGLRLETYNRTDEERTARFGQKEIKKGALAGKKVDRSDWVVYAYLGKGQTGPGNQTVKPATTAASKGRVAAQPPADDFDVPEASKELLRTILAKAKDKQMAKDRLSTAILQNTVKDGPLRENRDKIRAFLGDDNNLRAIAGVDFDLPTGTLTLIPVE